MSAMEVSANSPRNRGVGVICTGLGGGRASIRFWFLHCPNIVNGKKSFALCLI